MTDMEVFPTGVGMNRDYELTTPDFDSVPHRRGDEPFYWSDDTTGSACSPQAWG